MKHKYNIGGIVLFLICLAVAVLLFPIASDNKEIYESFLLTSIAILILIMLFLIKVNVLDN